MKPQKGNFWGVGGVEDVGNIIKTADEHSEK